MAVSLVLGIYLMPGLDDSLVYDRSAIISGQFWRMITGHLVHFSFGHMFYDMTVLAVTGWFIKFLEYRHLTFLCLISSILISMSMLVMLPEMSRYGGMSGISIASTVYLALKLLHEPPALQQIGRLILLLCLGRLAYDSTINNFMILDLENVRVVPVYLSHLIGAVSGAGIYLWSITK